MKNDLIIFEQFRYDFVLQAINSYCPPSVARRTIQELDELIDSLLEDIEPGKR